MALDLRNNKRRAESWAGQIENVPPWRVDIRIPGGIKVLSSGHFAHSPFCDVACPLYQKIFV
jgi:hypothetical protein